MTKKALLYCFFLLFSIFWSMFIVSADYNEYQVTNNSDTDSLMDADSHSGTSHVAYVKWSYVYYVNLLWSEELVWTGTSPAIAVDNSGTPHIAYLNWWAVYYNYYDGDWDNETLIPAGTSANAVDIDTDSNNKVHILARAYYYDDSGYRNNKIDIVYFSNTSGSFSFVEGWNWIWDYWSPDGRGLYFSSNPIAIKIDSSNNYHIVFRRQEYWKTMWWNDTEYRVMHYTNIIWGNTSLVWNHALYKNWLTTSGTTAHLMYGSPFRYATIAWGTWSETITGMSWTPNLDSDNWVIWLAYRDSGSNIIYMENNGSWFTGSVNIATSATEAWLAMDTNLFVYYIKSDGNDNEIYLKTDATMDNTAPTMTITSPLEWDVVKWEETLSFTGTELVDPECSVDGSSWSICTWDVTTLTDIIWFDSLSDGPFAIYMKETDGFGNTGTGNESGIIKDTTAPSIVYSWTMAEEAFSLTFTGLVVEDSNFDLTWWVMYFGTGDSKWELIWQTEWNMNMLEVGTGTYGQDEAWVFTGLTNETDYYYYYVLYDIVDNTYESPIFNTQTSSDPVSDDFNDIYDDLLLSWVNSNLDDVDSFNIDSFDWLYFEMEDFWKVTFSWSIDLSDEDTQTYLENLLSVLDMDLWYLDFQLSGTDFQSYSAHIELYLEEVSFPNWPIDVNNLAVFNDIWIPIDPSTTITNLSCAEVSIGNILQICSFDTAHFTSFDLIPTLTSVTIESNNSNDSELAKPGDMILLEFTSSEPIKNIVTSIATDNNLTGSVILTGSETEWTALYTMWTWDNEGLIPFVISYSDMNNNAGTTVTITTDTSTVTFDKTSPTASISYSTTAETEDNVIATLTGASEDITITNNWGEETYTFTDNGSFTFEFEDNIWNIGSTTATVSNIIVPTEMKVSAWWFHSCSLMNDGSVLCWGRNKYKQIWDGTTLRRKSPVAVEGLTNVEDISLWKVHSCVLIDDDTVKCWGRNNYGQLGDDTIINAWSPVDVSGLTNVTQLVAWYQHNCALIEWGTVKCWGWNKYGQLGDGTVQNRLTPVTVVGLSWVVEISAGWVHTCALLDDDTVKCWGRNNYGQLGDGTTVRSKTPISIIGLSNVVNINLWWYHSCALIDDDTVKCWGRNNYGQLWLWYTSTMKKSPESVVWLSNIDKISLWHVSSCALLTDGTVSCWWKNNYGQLSSGDTTNSSSPESISAELSNIEYIEMWYQHTGIKTDEDVIKYWGFNKYGQVGDGTTEDKLVPTDLDI